MTARTRPRTTSRALRTEADWWRVHAFIIETYPITPTGQNWEHRRWEGYRFHEERPIPIRRFREIVRIWESDGRIVGVANPEDGGDVHLQVHPGFRRLESEMLAWGEEHLSAPTGDGKRRTISTFAYRYDTLRRHHLEERGWKPLDAGWVARRLRLSAVEPLPTPEIEGYVLRPTSPGDPDLAQHMADILNAGFGRTSHTAKEYATFMAKAPVFSHDLNLVAEVPDGSFAAHVGCNFDARNRMGFYEPVCTHPDHRRQGLAQALMLEGLNRFKALGTTDVYVETGDDPAANALYDSVGFTEGYWGNLWRKTW
ncbi:MAG: GNAT family N-acetyltransferase [Actinomycetota bacterium]